MKVRVTYTTMDDCGYTAESHSDWEADSWHDVGKLVAEFEEDGSIFNLTKVTKVEVL